MRSNCDQFPMKSHVVNSLDIDDRLGLNITCKEKFDVDYIWQESFLVKVLGLLFLQRIHYKSNI